MFKYRLVTADFRHAAKVVPGDLVIVGCSLRTIVSLYGHWRPGQLKDLARQHSVEIPRRTSVADLPAFLSTHECTVACQDLQYVFQVLSKPRSDARLCPTGANVRADDELESSASGPVPEPSVDPTMESDAYLDIANTELRRAIISEWEKVMSLSALRDVVCAVCGRCSPEEKITYMKPARLDFSLLCNDSLPEEVLPISYARAEYGGAILHPKGMTRLEARGDLRVCNECRRDLTKRRMPKYALANWLYYGHDRLPDDVQIAFKESTHVERMLISRARASTISFKFSSLRGHALFGTSPQISQKCMKGNVAIHPQDATHLNEVLPPGNDVIRDTICAVFVGEKKPTKETIESLHPVCVRKSRVKKMIDFLISKNPHYSMSDEFRGFSQRNMDGLFGPDSAGVEVGVPCAMEVGHIEMSDAVEGATDSGYAPGVEVPQDPSLADSDMLMENVGYTDGDDTPVSRDEMGRKALSHCLRGGSFVKSQAGSKFVPDFENPQLLSWLFPHLDPWGLGGFYEKRRQRPLTLDQQLKYLLVVDGSPFRHDPDFAFVYYNIRQKKAVLDSVSFQVGASQRERVIAELMRVNVAVLDKLIVAYSRNPRYRPESEEEKALARLLLKVNTVAHDLPGSNGYKITLRNQIRGLINFQGTPTLFITLNPSDRDHPLVRLYAGHEIDPEKEMRGEELSRWQRSVLAARNPDACARFFHKMITNFINVVLRFGRPGNGLFG
ncbi:hypothetical protein FKP32DRAFT_1577333, partial [Trametes sanguinea]